MHNKSRWLRNVLYAGVIFSVIELNTDKAFAATYTYPTESWYKPTDPSIVSSFAPEKGSTWFFEEIGSSGYRYVKPVVTWQYTAAQIKVLDDYYNDRVPSVNCFKDKCYPGMDISITDDYNTTVNAVKANLTTNLPNPYFDVDDDGHNAYNDESEVSSLRPDLMTAMPREYNFVSFFEVVNNAHPVTFEFNAIESDDWYDGSSELQTVKHQLLKSRTLYK